MRILPLVLLAAAWAGIGSLAQPAAPAAEVHCERDDNSGQDSMQAERACLARMEGLASRMDDELRLTLEGGSIKAFTDERNACERHDAERCLRYRLAAYYPKQGLFVVDQLAYESSRALVVSRRGGAAATVDVPPHLSPGGTRMVAAAAIEAWEVENELAIYSVRDGVLEWEWSYKARDYEQWEFVAWEGDERIRLNVTLWAIDANGAKVLTERPAELHRTTSGWQLNRNLGR
jgi:hypothetical protein